MTGLSSPGSWSAPGKAFLLGELAVLVGAPGIVATVNRRVQVRSQATSGDVWVLKSRVPAHERKVPLRGLLEGPPHGDLCAAVVQALSRRGWTGPRAWMVESDVSELVDAQAGPVGLGSSAASALLLTRALAPDWPDAVVSGCAVQAHRTFQGNLGSGYDVVASLHGGISLIQASGNGELSVEPLAPPSDLVLVLCRSGPALSTAFYVGEMVRAAQSNSAVQRTLKSMGDVVTPAAQAFRAGDAPAIVTLTRAFVTLERELGQYMGWDLVPDAMLALDAQLAKIGAVCKPSGAGADLVMIWCPQAVASLLEGTLAGHGLQRLPVSLEATGLRRES